MISRNFLTSGRESVVEWIEGLSDAQFAYVMLLPALLLLGVMAFWPLLNTFETSLHADSALRTRGAFVGLENYVAILLGERNPLLPRPFLDPNSLLTSAVVVTLAFTVIAVCIETVLGLGQALILNTDFLGRRWVRVALLFPWTVPVIVQGMLFLLLFEPSIGFVAEPLQRAGVIGPAPLSTTQTSLFVVILADVWKQTPFMALLILAGLKSIDDQLYDVANVAGASAWQRFRLITLPLVLPTLLVALLFRTVAAMKVYGSISTIAGCNVVPSLSCLVVMTFNNGQFGSAATIAFITAVIIGLLILLYFPKFLRSQRGLA